MANYFLRLVFVMQSVVCTLYKKCYARIHRPRMRLSVVLYIFKIHHYTSLCLSVHISQYLVSCQCCDFLCILIIGASPKPSDFTGPPVWSVCIIGESDSYGTLFCAVRTLQYTSSNSFISCRKPVLLKMPYTLEHKYTHHLQVPHEYKYLSKQLLPSS